MNLPFRILFLLLISCLLISCYQKGERVYDITVKTNALVMAYQLGKDDDWKKVWMPDQFHTFKLVPASTKVGLLFICVNNDKVRIEMAFFTPPEVQSEMTVSCPAILPDAQPVDVQYRDYYTDSDISLASWDYADLTNVFGEEPVVDVFATTGERGTNGVIEPLLYYLKRDYVLDRDKTVVVEFVGPHAIGPAPAATVTVEGGEGFSSIEGSISFLSKNKSALPVSKVADVLTHSGDWTFYGFPERYQASNETHVITLNAAGDQYREIFQYFQKASVNTAVTLPVAFATTSTPVLGFDGGIVSIDWSDFANAETEMARNYTFVANGLNVDWGATYSKLWLGSSDQYQVQLPDLAQLSFGEENVALTEGQINFWSLSAHYSSSDSRLELGATRFNDLMPQDQSLERTVMYSEVLTPLALPAREVSEGPAGFGSGLFFKLSN